VEYQGTLSSAKEFAAQGRLEEWVHAYLVSDGRNQDFSRGLKGQKRFFLGPCEMPLSLFKRCCGPEDNMQWRVNREGFERRVDGLMDAMRHNADIPPLIVHFSLENGHGAFELNDGNHRWEAYRRLGMNQCHVIFWITDEDEYHFFQKEYGFQLHDYCSSIGGENAVHENRIL